MVIYIYIYIYIYNFTILTKVASYLVKISWMMPLNQPDSQSDSILQNEQNSCQLFTL